MGNSWFAKVIADVSPLFQGGETSAMNALDLQTTKPAFIEVLNLTDDQLIKCLWLSANGFFS